MNLSEEKKRPLKTMTVNQKRNMLTMQVKTTIVSNSLLFSTEFLDPFGAVSKNLDSYTKLAVLSKLLA